MKLSASLLAEELEKYYSLRTGDFLSLQPELDHILFWTEDSAWEEYTIYIVTAPLSPEQEIPSTCMLIFTEEAAGKLSVCPENTCCLSDPSLPSTEVFNTLMHIFAHYSKWMAHLTELRLSDSTIQSLLEASYPIFHNPLMVMGMDFTIIAKVFPDSTPFQDTVYGSTESTYLYITSVKQDPLFNQVREINGYFQYPDKVTGVNSLCVNIKKFDVTSYRLLLMDYEQPLNENRGFLLEYLAELIEHALLHNTIRQSSRDTSLHSVFLHILSDRTADFVTISQKLDSLGWYSRNEFFCIVLQISYLDQQNLTANAICTYVQSIIESSCALPYKDSIVIYINMTRGRLTVETVTEKLNYFIKNSYLRAGCSRVMSGHMNLRRQYIQATLALEVGSRKHPFQWIHQFNDIAFYYILEQSTRKLPGYMLSHEKLLKLQEVDQTNKTEYMKTLRVYLDNHLNAVQSARILYIHRSTFLYRLEKIKSVLETSFEDPDELLYLMLSFRFIDMENELEPEDEGE